MAMGRLTPWIACWMLLINLGSAWSEVLVPAARVNDLAEVKAILAEGFDPDEIGNDGMTALSHAVRWDNLDMARVLLEAGADPSGRYQQVDLYEYAESLLVHAVMAERMAMADLLLSFGARKTALDDHYRREFELAFQGGDFSGAPQAGGEPRRARGAHVRLAHDV